MNITEEVLDGVRELITIGVGRSGGMLSRLTHAHVTLTVPDVRISDDSSDNGKIEDFNHLSFDNTSNITLPFSGEITGSLSLMIPHASALNLVAILSGEEGSPDEMDALRVETLLEVGNIIISSVMSAMSILLSSRLHFEFPSYQTEKIHSPFNPGIRNRSDIAIMANTHFAVQQKDIAGEICILLTRESYDHIEKRIGTIMETGL